MLRTSWPIRHRLLAAPSIPHLLWAYRRSWCLPGFTDAFLVVWRNIRGAT